MLILITVTIKHVIFYLINRLFESNSNTMVNLMTFSILIKVLPNAVVYLQMHNCFNSILGSEHLSHEYV